MSTLLTKILEENTTAIELKPINDVLQAEMNRKIITDPANPILTNSITRPKPVPLSKGQLHIKRPELLTQLYSFAANGNGLVVGGPGEGKTFLLQALQREYYSKGIPCYIIPVENLVTGSDENITSELGGVGNWLQALMGLPSSYPKGPKSLLLFDAYDTAKDPDLKSAVLKQIKKAIQNLNPSWNILVSARRYEADKSPALLELFPDGNGPRTIRSRLFEVPLLEIVEIRSSLRQKRLLATFEKSTKQLQLLLQVPYYLQLFEQLFSGLENSSRQQIEIVETEEQFLSLFWSKKVTPDTVSILFIGKLAHYVSDHLKHTCPKIHLVNETHSSILDHLIGNGILHSSSVTGQMISFSHNILLDYAISLYVIPEDPSALTDFLQRNQRHWLLFRASNLYFFSRLWRTHRTLFWKHYRHLTSFNSPSHRLFRQIVLNFVLGSVYESFTEIDAAYSPLPANERIKSYRKLLEVLRYLNKAGVPVKEYHLLLHISQRLDVLLAWDMGFLINRAVNQAIKAKMPFLLELMSEAAINYMQFYLTERKVAMNRNQMDGNAGGWAVDNLCRTYQHNATASKRLLIDCLCILHEPGFPIRIFYHLVDRLVDLSLQDPRLAKLIFATIYNHQENSDEPTYLGNDVALSLKSNRGQDFQSLHYTLERCFPALIRQQPEIWLAEGIAIVNTHNLKAGYYSKKPKAALFTLGNKKARIMGDFIHYDQHYDKENGPISFITKIFAFLSETADRRRFNTVRELLLIAFKIAQAASLWTELIRFIAKYPKAFKREAFSVLTCPVLLSSGNTAAAACDLIESAWPEFSSKRLKQIEAAIVALPKSKILDSRGMNSIMESLLKRIPGHSATTGEATATSGQKTPASAPPLSPFRKPEPEIIRRPPDPIETAVADEIALLKAFNDKYDVTPEPAPPSPEYTALLPVVTGLFKFRAAASPSSSALVPNCDDEICRYCRIVSKQVLDFSAEIRQPIESIATYYILAIEYMIADYRTGPLSGGIQGYTPTPRINATKTLLHLLRSDPSGLIHERIFHLFPDNDHNIRFIVLRSLIEYWHKERPKFWTIVSSRIPVEENPLCLQLLLQGISYTDIIESDLQKVEILTTEAARILQWTNDRLNDLFQSYSILLVRLYHYFESQKARELMDANLGSYSFSGPLIFTLINFLDPHANDNQYESDPSVNEALFGLLTDIINRQFAQMQGKTVAQLSAEDLKPLDQIISQMYFTFVLGKREYSKVKVSELRKTALFNRLRPIFTLIVDGSAKIDTGFMVAQTGCHLVQILHYYLTEDPSFVLSLLASTVKSSSTHGFTYGQSAFKEISRITESIITDHAEILAECGNLDNLLTILDLFAESGWVEALELTWRVKDAF